MCLGLSMPLGLSGASTASLILLLNCPFNVKNIATFFHFLCLKINIMKYFANGSVQELIFLTLLTVVILVDNCK